MTDIQCSLWLTVDQWADMWQQAAHCESCRALWSSSMLVRDESEAVVAVRIQFENNDQKMSFMLCCMYIDGNE